MSRPCARVGPRGLRGDAGLARRRAVRRRVDRRHGCRLDRGTARQGSRSAAACWWRRRASTVGAARRRRWNVGRARPTARHGAGRSRPAGRRAKAQPAAALADAQRDGTFFDIEVLPAGHGDCLWIEYGDGTATHRWLIDCGTQGTANELLHRVEAVPQNERFLELFVLSHIDSDHIGGALPFFKAVQQRAALRRRVVQRLAASLGPARRAAGRDVLDGDPGFRAALERVARGRARSSSSGDELPVHVLPGGMKLTLLSPTPARNREAEAGVDAGAEEVRARARGARGLQHGSSRARRRRRPTSTRSPIHGLRRRQRRAQRHEHRAAGRVRRRARCWPPMRMRRCSSSRSASSWQDAESRSD